MISSYNGTFLENIKISADSNGFNYGHGFFTTIRVKKSSPDLRR